MTKIYVSVNWDDITNGQPERNDACPIALALHRLGLKDVCIEPHEISYYNRDTTENYTAAVPRIAEQFINDFDRIHYAKPIEFLIDLLPNDDHPESYND